MQRPAWARGLGPRAPPGHCLGPGTPSCLAGPHRPAAQPAAAAAAGVAPGASAGAAAAPAGHLSAGGADAGAHAGRGRAVPPAGGAAGPHAGCAAGCSAGGAVCGQQRQATAGAGPCGWLRPGHCPTGCLPSSSSCDGKPAAAAAAAARPCRPPPGPWHHPNTAPSCSESGRLSPAGRCVPGEGWDPSRGGSAIQGWPSS